MTERTNQGHENLIKDLEELMNDVRAFEFSDFKGTKYATPKIELANRLLDLRVNVINGRYDD